MLQGYRVFDADAHGSINPSMWDDLPEPFHARRPRPVTIHDDNGLGNFTAGWLIEGSLEPHALGPGAQQANTPRNVLYEFGANMNREHCSVGSMTLNDPGARLADMDRMGFDVQMIFPSTLYAHMTSDPEFEAALCRAYNRFVAKQCAVDSRRLKWSGLLPLREPRQALLAIEEMQRLGARAAVVFGTAGERLLSDPSFLPIWDEFAGTELPLCVHMGMSYPPLAQLGRSIYDGHIIGMSLPAQLAFMAIVGHRMLDRYQDLKVAFLIRRRMDFLHGLAHGSLLAARSRRPSIRFEHAECRRPAALQHPRLRQIRQNFYRRRSRRPHAATVIRFNRRRSCTVLLRLPPR